MDELARESFVLGRIIGTFLVIWAFSLMAKRRECVEIVENLLGNPAALYLISLAILPIGLTIVILHPFWIIGWPVIITVIGWSLVLSSLIYLFLPYKAVIHFIALFNKPSLYVIHAFISLTIGIYMITMAF